MADTYLPRRASRSEFLPVRGLRYHVRVWDGIDAPPIVMMHGWMDVSASFQFLVDALATQRPVIAPDWRGFGLTDRTPSDSYWFPDYLADLDRLLDHYVPGAAVDLVGHSMGGAVAMLYGGVRPARVRRLVSLDGFGLRRMHPSGAPARYRMWLDQLANGRSMRDYGSRDEVAARLMAGNPRLTEPRARFLAGHWARPQASGRHVLLGDPAHKVVNPVLYRVEEVVAVWRDITAPVLLVSADAQDKLHRFVRTDEYRQRLLAVRDLREATVADAGHMLHHDQPEVVARLVEEFIDG